MPSKRAAARPAASLADTIGMAIGMAFLTLTAIGLTALAIAVGMTAFDGPMTAARATGLIAGLGIGMAAASGWAAVGAGVAACRGR